MSLFKRGSRWWAIFTIDGIRYQESTGTGNRRLAERVEQQLKDEVVHRQYQLPTADPNMTFEQLAARFIANATPRPHHLAKLELLIPYFGDTPLRSITKGLVREYRADRHRQKTLTDATVNRDVAVLRHLLYWATDEGLLATNPLARLKLVPERRRPRPVVTVAEEQLLLASAPQHLRELITVALDTGMRRGELLHQDWQHIDFTRNLIIVTRSKTLQGEGREIPMTPRVRQILEARRRDTGLLFTYRQHRIGTIKTAWRTNLRAAGIRHVRFHDLRHSFVTRLLEAGVLQEVRKALVGHTSGQGVHAVYSHVEVSTKRAAIATLEKWLAVEYDRLAQQRKSTSSATSSSPTTSSTSSSATSTCSPATPTSTPTPASRSEQPKED